MLLYKDARINTPSESWPYHNCTDATTPTAEVTTESGVVLAVWDLHDPAGNLKMWCIRWVDATGAHRQLALAMPEEFFKAGPRKVAEAAAIVASAACHCSDAGYVCGACKLRARFAKIGGDRPWLRSAPSSLEREAL